MEGSGQRPWSSWPGRFCESCRPCCAQPVACETTRCQWGASIISYMFNDKLSGPAPVPSRACCSSTCPAAVLRMPYSLGELCCARAAAKAPEGGSLPAGIEWQSRVVSRSKAHPLLQTDLQVVLICSWSEQAMMLCLHSAPHAVLHHIMNSNVRQCCSAPHAVLCHMQFCTTSYTIPF